MLALVSHNQWHPGIGDPTFMGWLTVAAYFVAVVVCGNAALVASRNERKRGGQGATLFWLLFTCGLLFLGINKQLDLQTWFTQFGKRLAQAEGWYGQRRIVQTFFIALIAAGGLSLLVVFWRWARVAVPHYRLALLGGVFLGCFILVRAASFHHIDELLGRSIVSIRINCILELGGIACVALGAARSCRLNPG